MTDQVVLTAFEESPFLEFSKAPGNRYFKKQILPRGRFNYKGHTLVFDDEYFNQIKLAFKQGAMDQVPFQWAGASNSHDDDPDRYRGEVVDVQIGPDGLDGLVKMWDDKSAEFVRKNPKLGVSARLDMRGEDLGDGRRFPVIMDQLLGTLNPRVKGLKPWEEVALSMPSGVDVADMSGESYDSLAEKDGIVTAPTQTATDQTQSNNSDPNAQGGAGNAGDANAGGNAPPTGASGTGQNQNGRTVNMTDEEYETYQEYISDRELADALAGAATGGDSTVDPVVARLSNENKQTSARVIELSKQLANERYDNLADAYKRGGVPPALVELAKPVLTSIDSIGVVCLSDDGSESTVDAREIVTKMLDECKGILEFSENGHQISTTEAEALAEEAKAFIEGGW